MGVQINGSEGNVIATKGTFSGDVGIGGTLTYEDVTNIDSVGLITARNGIEIGARPGVAASISVDGNMIVSGISTFNNDIKLPDSKKIVLGTGSDLEIYHDGSSTQILNNNNQQLNISSDNALNLTSRTGQEYFFRGYTDGAVELYHNNEAKILTESNGATVQDLTATGTYLSITSSSGNNGKIYGVSGTTIGFLDSQNHWLIKGIKDGAVELYYDNTKMLETYSNGVKLPQGVNSHLWLTDGGKAMFGTGTDLEIYYDGTDGFVNQKNNALKFQHNGTTKFFVGSGYLSFQDNYKIGLGNSQDLSIYHDGTNNVFDHATGDSTRFMHGSEKMLVMTPDSHVELYYDNSKKLNTTSTGISVTGSVSVTTEPAFRAGLTANLSVGHNSNYTVTFNEDSGTALFDTNGCFDTSNHRFTPTLAGYYHLHFVARVDLPSADHLYQARIRNSSNEIIAICQNFNKSGNDNSSVQTSCLYYFNGSSDYVTAEFYQNSGSTITLYGGATTHYQSFFEGYFVRSA